MLDRRSLAAVSAAALLAFAAAPSRAHETESGPNGGPMVETKGLHLELVAKGTDLAVVVSDAAHAPIATKGASGRAVILEGSGQVTVPLAPADPDRLAAKLEKPLPAGTRVVVSAKLAGGQDLLARFVVK